MIIEAAKRLEKTEEYYFSKKLKEIALLRESGKQIINLGIGSPDLPPHPSVIKELTKTADSPFNHGYQSYQGIPALRKAICKYSLTQHDITLNSEEEILPLIGSKEGIMHISMAFLNKGDKVLVPNPGYPTYASVSNIVQAEIMTYSLSEKKNWQIDLDQLKKLPLDQVKIMWVNYPNMPTGSPADVKNMEELIDLAVKHQFLIINDNPYHQLFPKPAFSIFQIKKAKEVALELHSMSKSHNMAGWRMGWVAGKKNYIESILKIKSNMDSGMFLPVQKAAIKALELPENYYSELKEIYKNRREIVFKIFEELKCSFSLDQYGMFVWAKIPKNVHSSEKFTDTILQRTSVFITPGFIFGDQGNQFVRISLCAPESTLEEALNKIISASL